MFSRVIASSHKHCSSITVCIAGNENALLMWRQSPRICQFLHGKGKKGQCKGQGEGKVQCHGSYACKASARPVPTVVSAAGTGASRPVLPPTPARQHSCAATQPQSRIIAAQLLQPSSTTASGNNGRHATPQPLLMRVKCARSSCQRCRWCSILMVFARSALHRWRCSLPRQCHRRSTCVAQRLGQRSRHLQRPSCCNSVLIRVQSNALVQWFSNCWLDRRHGECSAPFSLFSLPLLFALICC